jgi:hypothetical protein
MDLNHRRVLARDAAVVDVAVFDRQEIDPPDAKRRRDRSPSPALRVEPLLEPRVTRNRLSMPGYRPQLARCRVAVVTCGANAASPLIAVPMTKHSAKKPICS